jgi:hypothetical protein
MIIISTVVLCVGGWLAWIYWDSRRTWLDESARFDAALVENDLRTAQEIDAAEEWQRKVEAQEFRY